MALVINATVGSEYANSYVTAAEMTTYCEGRLNAGIWTAAQAQLPALVEATRDITNLYWKGSRVYDTQALAWPRAYVQDPDAPYDDETLTLDDIVYYPEDIVPQRVKDATCELALQYLKAGTTDLAMPDPTDGVIRRKVDVLETQYAADGSRTTRGVNRFPRVMALIGMLLAAGAGNVQVTRV
jgi:hypothetical protein